MIDSRARLLTVTALLVITFAPAAVADQITLVGVSAGRTGGTNPVDYLTPYKLSINGGPTVLGICDDYWTNSTVGGHWTATPYDASALSSAKFASLGVAKYYQAAYLGNLLLALDLTTASTLADQTALSFAIWEIFNTKATDSPLNHLSTTPQIRDQAQWYIAQAAQNATASSFQGWTAYTPSPINASQEFLVRVPETPAVAMLGMNIMVLIGLAIAFRKRLIRLN